MTRIREEEEVSHLPIIYQIQIVDYFTSFHHQEFRLLLNAEVTHDVQAGE